MLEHGSENPAGVWMKKGAGKLCTTVCQYSSHLLQVKYIHITRNFIHPSLPLDIHFGDCSQFCINHTVSMCKGKSKVVPVL